MKTEVSEKENIQSDIITYLIGSFEPITMLINHSQTNKKNYMILSPLLKKLTLAQQLYKITYVEKSKDEKPTESPPVLTEYYINELKTKLVEDLKFRTHATDVIRKALSKRFYTLIPFLLEQKFDINSSYATSHTESYTYKKIICHGDGEIDATGHRTTVTITSVAQILYESPLDLERVRFYIQHGGDLTLCWTHVLCHLVEQLETLEKDAKAYSNYQKNIIAELLLHCYRNKYLEYLKDYIPESIHLRQLLQLIKSINHPLINCLETGFLIEQLKNLIPFKINIFADQRDLPTIKIALSKLQPLLYHATPKAATTLEYIKYFLLTHAKKSPEKPGPLFTLLCQLKKDRLIICNPDYINEQKQRTSLLLNTFS